VSVPTHEIDQGTAIPQQPGATVPESVLPELRPMWWEQGMRARVDAGLFRVFAGMPRLVVEALRISWSADRVRTAIVAVATLAAGVMATFGLLATQRVLVALFAAGPTPDGVRRLCLRWRCSLWRPLSAEVWISRPATR
jgi:ATP-binding cassette subfamily B protein